MAKDPAFLFYFQDYLNGTRFMTFEEKGAYMELLCHQADKGRFTLDIVKKILRNEFERTWSNISDKFICENGFYFNQRLEDEKEKRRKHAEHQKENISKRWNKDGNTKSIPSYDNGNGLVIPLENINENEDVIKDSFLKEETREQEITLEPLEERKSKHEGPAYAEVKQFFVDLNNRPEAEAVTFWNEYEQKEWFVHNKEGTPARKMKTGRDWQLKAEQWIYKSRTNELEKKNGSKGKQNSSHFRRTARGEVTQEQLNEGLDKAFR